MIGLAPYCRRWRSRCPSSSAPPSPRNATTCVPGRRKRRGDRHRHARAHRADHRRQKHLALAEADIAVHEAAEIAGVGRHRRVGREVLVDLADDRREIDAVACRLPFLRQQLAVDRVQPGDPAAALRGIGGAPRCSSALMTSCGLAGMPRSGRQTRPTSLASGQTWTNGSCGCGAVGKL